MKGVAHGQIITKKVRSVVCIVVNTKVKVWLM